MKLLLLGASGGIGRHVVPQALERGHTLTVLVRREIALPAGVRVEGGDPADPADVRRAIAGCDAVVSCLGARRQAVWNPYSPILGSKTIASDTARVLVQAMKEAGVPRVIAVSAAGVADSARRMNLVMKFLVATSSIGVAYRDLAVMEGVYAESGLDWCCVRPVTLTDGPRRFSTWAVDRFDATSTISRADVAHALLERLDGPTLDRTPQLASAPFL